MGDVGPHFSRSEFRCHGFRVAGHPAHDTLVHEVLVENLERLRAIVGRPLVVVSGHRCAWWNRRVGGARQSQHLFGHAVDLVQGYATVAQAERAGFTGIGNRGQWATHVDVRSRRARWEYT